MAEPLISERVPYLIVYGSPNRPLFELVRSPEDLIQNHDLKVNYEYYIMKQILPPIDRIMVLMDLNVFEWIKNLSFKPKIFQYTNDINQAPSTSSGVGKANPVSLSSYIFSTDCVLCGQKRGKLDKQKICDKCRKLDQTALTKLRVNFQRSEKKLLGLIRVCQSCTGSRQFNMGFRNECISMDCPNNFLLLNAKQEYQKTDYIRNVIDEYF